MSGAVLDYMFGGGATASSTEVDASLANLSLTSATGMNEMDQVMLSTTRGAANGATADPFLHRMAMAGPDAVPAARGTASGWDNPTYAPKGVVAARGEVGNPRTKSRAQKGAEMAAAKRPDTLKNLYG